MVLRFGQLIMVAALFAAIGGHWAVLQSYAWATMFAENLQKDSMCAAVARTFDGKHPCACCKAIEAGKSAEKKSEFPSLKANRFEFTTEQLRWVFVPTANYRLLPTFEDSVSPEPRRPLLPPPRHIPA